MGERKCSPAKNNRGKRSTAFWNTRQGRARLVIRTRSSSICCLFNPQGTQPRNQLAKTRETSSRLPWNLQEIRSEKTRNYPIVRNTKRVDVDDHTCSSRAQRKPMKGRIKRRDLAHSLWRHQSQNSRKVDQNSSQRARFPRRLPFQATESCSRET